jgi:hypothetical protein
MSELLIAPWIGKRKFNLYQKDKFVSTTMQFSLSDDFLLDAQRLDPLQMDLKQDPIRKSLNTNFLGFGSCFAQNLQRELIPFTFPFYFNRSICAYYTTRPLKEMLEWLVADQKHTEDDLYIYDEEDVSSYRYFRIRNYGKNAKERTLDEMHRLDEELKNAIQDADIFLITLGTAMHPVMKRNEKAICSFFGIPVEEARCDTLTSEEIAADLESIHSNLLTLRNQKPFQTFITVSPQRYNWNQSITGMPPVMENNLSKSLLRVAIHNFLQNKSDENIHYFPSFEMVIDELRLHESISIYDHLHINSISTPKYVTKRFLKQYCTDQVQQLLALITDINRAYDLTVARTRAGALVTSQHLRFAWETILDKTREYSKDISCDNLLSLIFSKLEQFEEGVLILEDHIHEIVCSDEIKNMFKNFSKSKVPAS